MTAALDEDTPGPAVGGRPNRRRLVLLGCIVGAVVLAAAFGYEARVVFAVPTQEVPATVAVPVAAELDPQRASVEERHRTTGGVGEQRATGRVVIAFDDRPTVFGCHERGDCPPAAVVLPAGTRVATCAHPAGFAITPCREADVVFTTREPLRVRNGTSAEAPIRAVEPGTRGNVRHGAIIHLIDPPQVPHAEVTVRPSPETAGGTDAATGIVAQADVDRVVKAHEATLRMSAEKRLRDHADGRGHAAAVTTVDLEVTADPKVGTSAPTVQVTVAAVARGVGYDEDRLREHVERALTAALAPGQFLVPDSVSWSGVTVRGAEVVVAAQGRSSAVDPAAVRRQVARRWTGSARADLERRYGDDVVHLAGRPFLLPVGPLFGSRVDVTFDTKRHR